MSSVVIKGDTSGQVTLDAPAVAGTVAVTLPSASGTMATTGDLKEIGVGQTWTDVTASRVKATTYTNSTGKPIMVAVTCGSSGAPSPYTMSAYVGSVIVSQASTGSDVDNLTWIVPNGSTYKIELASTATTISIWAELR